MKKKGFATSAILYTLLLLFLVLMVGILNNLQSKKTILDQLKMETIQAIESSSNTCNELQEKIDQLQEELDLLKGQGDATSEEILEGKTAIVQGELVTGTYQGSGIQKILTNVKGLQTTDIKKFSDNYQNLTDDNFLLVLEDKKYSYAISEVAGKYNGNYATVGYTISSAYDSNTGQLSTRVLYTRWVNNIASLNTNTDLSYSVYLYETK